MHLNGFSCNVMTSFVNDLTMCLPAVFLYVRGIWKSYSPKYFLSINYSPSPEDQPQQRAQVSYVISQILNATVQCNLFRQTRKESTIFRSLSLDTSECLVMRWSACILHAVVSSVPSGWPAVTQLYSLMVMLQPIFMFFIINYDVFSL